MNIKRLKSTDKNFLQDLKEMLAFDSDGNEEIIKTTHEIVNLVKRRGDQALIELTD